MRIISLSLLFLLLPFPITSSQALPQSRCGPGGCVIGPKARSQPAPHDLPINEMRGGTFVAAPVKPGKYAWDRINKDQTLLRRDGKIVGQWYWPHGKYYPWDGNKNLPTSRPPIDPPMPCACAPGNECGCLNGGECICEPATVFGQLQAWQLNGVDNSKIDAKERISYCGKEVHPENLPQAFADGLTDDSGKGHFVVLAKDAATREKVLADWATLPQDFRDRYNVCAVPPDHFWMQDRFAGKPRFHSEGDPSVILMGSTGKVLYRAPQGGQVYAAAVMQDLLKADPQYDPKKDPGSKTPSGLPQLPPIVWIGGGLAVLFLLARKQ